MGKNISVEQKKTWSYFKSDFFWKYSRNYMQYANFKILSGDTFENKTTIANVY